MLIDTQSRATTALTKGTHVSESPATPLEAPVPATPAHTTPKALADVIGVDPKVLRSHLRKTYTRPAEAKNTTWLIPLDIADEVIAHYDALAAKKTDTPS